MYHESLSNHCNKQDVFTQLIELNHILFTDGQYAEAYHILAAAFHYARAMKNADYLLEIKQLAIDEIECIDTIDPLHKLSTNTTHAQNRINIYASLAVQTDHAIDMIEIEKDYT